MEKGYIQVYTGNGKGKTTAMLGLTVRAVGAGLRVYIGQFIKDMEYHEIAALRNRFPEVAVRQYGNGKGCFIGRNPAQEDIDAAKAGLLEGTEALESGKYDVVIMDEINVAVHLKLLTTDDVLGMIARKPDSVELVLTGRGAPQAVINAADLVSEVREIKHYYAAGVQARDGIER